VQHGVSRAESGERALPIRAIPCSTSVMEHVESADGTRIAFTRVGEGEPVVVVGGAFSTQAAGAPLAAALAEQGFTGVTIDRRARGGSGDTRPYAPVREAEDLTAVIEAVGGRAHVLGHSSGAVLALLAAGEGAPIAHLFLSEPPFHFGVDPAAPDLPDRLQALVDEERPEEAVVLFQREGIGLPDHVIAGIRSSPMFAGLVPLAQSVVYDAVLTAAVETPTAAMTGVDVPATILRGEPTFPFLVGAVERLAAAMPGAELVVVPESHDHGVDPEATARLVRSRIA
jgi:pimeloyl-ACP methyl ester carboxylesterase